MLARAERRSRQAAKLVEKWKARLAKLDREGVAAKQAKLWVEDHVEKGTKIAIDESGSESCTSEIEPPTLTA